MKYRCEECANAGTPICDVCRVIEKPSGDETRPTMFVRLSKVPYLPMAIIKSCVEQGIPIPVAAVIKYNREVEQDAEE